MTDTISCSVVKRDHLEKAEGRSLYIGDYSSASDGRPLLTGKLLHSEKARAKILSVRVPPLPDWRKAGAVQPTAKRSALIWCVPFWKSSGSD